MHKGICKFGSNNCYSCGHMGHYAYQCPNKQQGMGGGRSNQNQNQPQYLRAIVGFPQQQEQHEHQPFFPQPQQPRQQLPPPQQEYQRVFALDQKPHNKDQGNLAGMGQLKGVSIIILFDTGASRSFISSACVDNFDLDVERASRNLRVTTPMGKITTINYVCPNLEFELGSLKLTAKTLYKLLMWDVDIILGMDWLTENFATIKCDQRQISFQPPGKEPSFFYGIERKKLKTSIISAIQAEKLLKNKDVQAYLVHLNCGDLEKNIDDVVIVREYKDVFPEALPGVPPDRQLEFTIDLEPSSAPISKAPYQMAPKELQELKIQIQELLDLGFIRPSVSLW